MVEKNLIKEGFNFSCDDTPDKEMTSSVNKSEKKCTGQSLKYML